MPRSRYCKSRSRSRSRSPRSRSRSWDRGRDRDRKDRQERSQRRKSSYRYVTIVIPTLIQHWQVTTLRAVWSCCFFLALFEKHRCHLGFIDTRLYTTKKNFFPNFNLVLSKSKNFDSSSCHQAFCESHFTLKSYWRNTVAYNTLTGNFSKCFLLSSAEQKYCCFFHSSLKRCQLFSWTHTKSFSVNIYIGKYRVN